MKLRPINQLTFSSKRVFLRTDLNVPLSGHQIMQDYKIKAILPTINYIQKNGGKVILATHLGRPQLDTAQPLILKKPADGYHTDSTISIASWLQKQGYSVDYEPDLLKAKTLSKQSSSILLLENMRFFHGEQEYSLLFAELLATLADVYINDAFGLIHRKDTSITLLAEQFSSEKRAAGLLMEREINELVKLKKQVKQPFILVLGGSKMKDKIALLNQFTSAPEAQRVTTIIIGGALAHVFLKAQGYALGASLIDEQALPFAKDFLNKAQERKITIMLPTDFLVVTDQASDGQIHAIDAIPSTGKCVDIGPTSIASFSAEIISAKTIFANGTMGMYENPAYAQGSKKILQTIATSSAYTIIGGGDAVAATYLFNLQDQMNFLSTGGGATLAFLGASDPEEAFPALNVLIR